MQEQESPKASLKDLLDDTWKIEGKYKEMIYSLKELRGSLLQARCDPPTLVEVPKSVACTLCNEPIHRYPSKTRLVPVKAWLYVEKGGDEKHYVHAEPYCIQPKGEK